MRIGLAYNLIQLQMIEHRPIDIIAEYDSMATIHAIQTALTAGGHQVELIDVDFTVFDRLQAIRPDMVFNIAEGIKGKGRESLFPCVCESLGIPYTGSDPVTLSICLDKARTKQILISHRLPSPEFQVLETGLEPIILNYPVILKLLAEGSSTGLDYDSVVTGEDRLRNKAAQLIETYQSPVLVESYLDGREFTIPIIGNNPPVVLPIVEILYDKVPHGCSKISLFTPDDPIAEGIHQLGRASENKPYNHQPICPAPLDKGQEDMLNNLALKAYQALGCMDWCRIDIRFDREQNPYILELNPIAGIDPEYLFPLSARAYGLSYDELINRILGYAMARYGLK